jgi:hypothetical protein
VRVEYRYRYRYSYTHAQAAAAAAAAAASEITPTYLRDIPENRPARPQSSQPPFTILLFDELSAEFRDYHPLPFLFFLLSVML